MCCQTTVAELVENSELVERCPCRIQCVAELVESYELVARLPAGHSV
jgi:hypothetical protein